MLFTRRAGHRRRYCAGAGCRGRGRGRRSELALESPLALVRLRRKLLDPRVDGVLERLSEGVHVVSSVARADIGEELVRIRGASHRLRKLAEGRYVRQPAEVGEEAGR